MATNAEASREGSSLLHRHGLYSCSLTRLFERKTKWGTNELSKSQSEHNEQTPVSEPYDDAGTQAATLMLAADSAVRLRHYIKYPVPILFKRDPYF